jgi:hypothetical protein
MDLTVIEGDDSILLEINNNVPTLQLSPPSTASVEVVASGVSSLNGRIGPVTLTAADIISGVLASARLGTGTASATTYLRGDGTWATPAGGSGSSSLATLTDVAIVSAVSGDFLRYDGAKWVDYILTKSDVALGSVDNTSDVNKPVSTAQQTALNLKANIASPTFTGTVGGITATMVGLGNVTNTSDANKPVSTAQAAADALKVGLAGTETITGLKTFSAVVDYTSAQTVYAGLTNASTRPALGIARIAGEISGRASTIGADDGFLRISAGGGATTGAKTWIDVSGYSTVPDMDRVIVFGAAGAERLRIAPSGVTSTVPFTGSGSGLTGIPESGVTNLTTDLGLKAPLAAPVFTGDAAFASIKASGANLFIKDSTATTQITITSAGLTAVGAITAASFSGVGTNLTALNATSLGSGTVPLARLGVSGTPSATTFLRGDNTWATPSGAGGSSTLAGLTDVAIVAAASGDFLRHNGTAWVDYVLTSTDVGLGSVNNTADSAKPVSTAQQTALNLKADLASPTFTGTVSGITKTMVGLGSVDNTADTAKPVSTAQQTALNLKANIASPTFTGTVSGITAAMVGAAATIHSHAATDITSGVIAIAQIPTGTTGTTVALGNHTHAAADIVSGVIATARLGTGTANSTTYLRGDGTWAVVSAGSSTLAALTDVAITAAAAGDFLRHNGTAWVDYVLTKSDVGLANVDNISDVNKPISTATQTALNLKMSNAYSISAVSGTTYTAVLGDAGSTLTVFTNASAVTYTIPLNSSVAYPIGTVLNCATTGAGQVTIFPTGGVVFIGGAYKSARQGAVWSLIKTGTDTWIVNGDVTP